MLHKGLEIARIKTEFYFKNYLKGKQDVLLIKSGLWKTLENYIEMEA